MSRRVRKLLKRPYELVNMLAFDPLQLVQKWRGVPYFAQNLWSYQRLKPEPQFRFTWRDLWFRSYDRFDGAGSLTFHYFHQDLWAAEHLFRIGVRDHVDVASRIDGFVAHALAFCDVTYIDIRPLAFTHPRFHFREGSVTAMPFPDGSVSSLSCLHVLEHIGLGRYGDPVDPVGYLKGGRELQRVLAPGSTLLFSTPVGRQRLCFDAHRIFDPETIVNVFDQLHLKSFSLVTDRNELKTEASFAEARSCEYGCGLFLFEKPVSVNGSTKHV